MAGLARAATQGPPVYTYTGTAPSGSCSGTRVLIDALGTGTYYCNAGTWALITGGGGGAPTTSQYWTGAADAGLSAEHNLGALATGLVLNTAGTPSAYGGGTCTAPNFIRVISASGAVTCAAPTLSLSSVSNPTGDWTATFPSGAKALWTFTGSTDEAFTIHGDGAFSGVGDLVHIHKSGTGATAGSDALHVEVASDLNMTGLRVTMANATRDAFNTNALVTAAGFVGPLTGAVTGNASTATALAADPADCSAGQAPLGITASGAVTGCFTPAGTYTLPAASTTLGGVKQAAACAAGNHVSSIGAGGELTCTADSGGAGGSPGGASGQVQYNNTSAFDGAANVLITAAEYLQIPEAAEPAAPASGVTLFSEHRTPARSELGWVGLSGKDHYAQDAVWQNYFQLFKSSGGTAVACTNCTATAYGTAAAATMTAGAFLTSVPRVRYNSAATINAPAGVRSSAGLTFHRGSVASTGGFFCVFRVGFPVRNGTNVDRAFIGLASSASAVITTGAPSALLNTAYWGWDATAPATAKLQACGNDGSGSAVCDTSCGADFIPGVTDAYELTIAAKPNDTSVHFLGKNLRTGTTCSFTQSTSANLPANTQHLTWHAELLKDGVTTTGTVGIDIISAYCESDN